MCSKALFFYNAKELINIEARKIIWKKRKTNDEHKKKNQLNEKFKCVPKYGMCDVCSICVELHMDCHVPAMRAKFSHACKISLSRLIIVIIMIIIVMAVLEFQLNFFPL